MFCDKDLRVGSPPREEFPQHQFRLLVGADVLLQTHEWKQWAKIEADFSPILVGRVGYENPEGCVAFPGISSTQIRKELTQNKIPSQFLTKSLQAFLSEFNPYVV